MENKNQIDKIIAYSLDLICILSIDGFFKLVSPIVAEVFGFSEEELVGENFMKFVHPEDFSAARLLIERLSQGQRVLNLEIRLLTKSESFRIISWHGQADSKTGEFYIFGRDITEQKQKEILDKKEQKRIQDESLERENLLTAVLENLPLAVFGKEIKNNFRCNIWNKTSEKLFGIKASDFIGKYDEDYFPKEQADFFRIKDIEASQSLEVISIDEEIARTANGEAILRTLKTVIRDSEGLPSILLGISEDITDKKKRESEKAAYEKKLELITDNMQGPISKINKLGQYEFCNKVYEDWFGIARNELIGKNPKDILPKDYYEFIRPYFEKALAGEFVDFQSTLFLDHEEKIKYLRVLYIPYQDKNGKADGFFIVVQDITNIKEAEIKLIQSSKMASLGEMSAGLAHEINNPLAIISGAMGLLVRFGHDPEKIKAKIDMVDRACKRIEHIVSGLRKFSRTDNSEDFDVFDLNDIIKESLRLTLQKSKRHNVPILFGGGGPFKIKCSEIEIQQVLINLINNAIDAASDLPDKWVKINISEEESIITLKVVDSGKGISTEIKDKIMDPFFTTKPVGKGTGLGLSITKGILDQHNASIAVGLDNGNTCFEVKFPKSVI